MRSIPLWNCQKGRRLTGEHKPALTDVEPRDGHPSALEPISCHRKLVDDHYQQFSQIREKTYKDIKYRNSSTRHTLIYNKRIINCEHIIHKR